MKDIEKWVMDFPEIIGEELLIITTNTTSLTKPRKILDILALDKAGNLQEQN
ncbi:MAG: hypothetical protein ABIM45_04365 [candidate division WOR-3 bacterium]